MEKQSTHQQQDSQYNLTTLFLVVAETFLTILFKTDSASRALADDLIEKNVTIAVQTYLPSFKFYAIFTPKGILLEQTMPAVPVSATVYASTPDLVHGFLTAPKQILDKIRLEGDNDIIKQLRLLMSSFNLQNVVTRWFKYFLVGFDGTEALTSSKSAPRAKQLLKKISVQQQMIDQLKSQVYQMDYQNKYSIRNYRLSLTLTILYALLITILSVFLYLHPAS